MSKYRGRNWSTSSTSSSDSGSSYNNTLKNRKKPNLVDLTTTRSSSESTAETTDKDNYPKKDVRKFRKHLKEKNAHIGLQGNNEVNSTTIETLPYYMNDAREAERLEREAKYKCERRDSRDRSRYSMRDRNRRSHSRSRSRERRYRRSPADRYSSRRRNRNSPNYYHRNRSRSYSPRRRRSRSRQNYRRCRSHHRRSNTPSNRRTPPRTVYVPVPWFAPPQFGLHPPPPRPFPYHMPPMYNPMRMYRPPPGPRMMNMPRPYQRFRHIPSATTSTAIVPNIIEIDTESDNSNKKKEVKK